MTTSAIQSCDHACKLACDCIHCDISCLSCVRYSCRCSLVLFVVWIAQSMLAGGTRSSSHMTLEQLFTKPGHSLLCTIVKHVLQSFKFQLGMGHWTATACMLHEARPGCTNHATGHGGPCQPRHGGARHAAALKTSHHCSH